MTTGGDVWRSVGWNVRPAMSFVPTVVKYAPLTTRTTVAGAPAAGVWIADDANLARNRRRSGERRRRRHRCGLDGGLALDAIEHVSRELHPLLAVVLREVRRLQAEHVREIEARIDLRTDGPACA